ncbi:MAG: [FeFe] hydrogenase H-cluster radical SAM maturase HydE [Bacteroidetes bacterium]|nr:[FeFe] hydrogenase H-cluster radical SAM maturase HydE [Bacteroidota bacterium]
MIRDILNKETLEKEDILELLDCNEDEEKLLFLKANDIRDEYIGRKIFLRGLVEVSNVCSKNCYYCGIRAGNNKVQRYTIPEKEVIEAVSFAWEQGFGSVVLQSGEVENNRFTNYIGEIIRSSMDMSAGELGLTLSCGEQSLDVYRFWREAGARRYLLRIEASDPDLYAKLHPEDKHHDYGKRMGALHNLRLAGFQTGTGVMIGLPFQTKEHLVSDLLFMRDRDIDMVGMGPYVIHKDTPLYEHRHLVPSLQERIRLSLRMVAILRIMMKDINIASTTALSAIDPQGKIMGLKAGANVIMPNITPARYTANYNLYDNKPYIDVYSNRTRISFEEEIREAGFEIGYSERGDSLHYEKRMAT